MSVNLGANKISSELKKYLDRSWLKRDTSECNASSVAITSTNKYYSGLAESRTHLLDISSEQAALALAVAAKDAHVTEIVSMASSKLLNPIVLKVLADHVRRTGTPMKYVVIDMEGNELKSINIQDLDYNPEVAVLEKIKTWQPEPNKKLLDKTRDLKEQLKECAEKGMLTHFSSSSKSCYGAAIIVDDTIYYGGVYSSFDHRMNLHAEMVAALSAFADGKKNISWIALMSTKFVEEAPQMCGCCRQFFSEIQEKTKTPINILTFSLDGKKVFKTTLTEYLPHLWRSGLSNS